MYLHVVIACLLPCVLVILHIPVNGFCCSWQVVSSCGSLRGLVSSHDSPHSVDSSNSSGKLS